MSIDKETSSFRDPSGFVFYKNNTIYRQINVIYKENYDLLMQSGLYEELVNAQLLIPHQEIDTINTGQDNAYKTIKPEPIPFISYPYEWCFSQLKNAALTCIKIQKIAMEYGMSLKDCSAYNIQFKNNKAIFIDTLSFEKYNKNKPWIAYKQFCQHFLAPLALMSYKDVRLNQLLKIYMDGIPLDLTSSLLPFYTWFKFSIFSHIHVHAKGQKHFSHKKIQNTNKMNKNTLMGLIDNLENTIKNLKWKIPKTVWRDYYKNTYYDLHAINHKKQIIEKFLNKQKAKLIWDLGANTGVYSRVIANKGALIVSFDIDYAAVEKNYTDCIKESQNNVFPLLLDLTNPSSNIGWANEERKSLIERAPADIVLALALIHHLCIANNLPFYKIAEFFYKICNVLIIEFVPKHDIRVQELLLNRRDIFTNYTQLGFENEFKKYFIIRELVKIKNTERTIYLMEKKK